MTMHSNMIGVSGMSNMSEKTSSFVPLFSVVFLSQDRIYRIKKARLIPSTSTSHTKGQVLGSVRYSAIGERV